MKTLHLTVKKKWFDLIESGLKFEEYREVKRYWIARLLSNTEYLVDLEGVKNVGARFNKFDLVKFTNGYSKNSQTVTFECKEIFIGLGFDSFGAEIGKEYFVIRLGKKVEPLFP